MLKWIILGIVFILLPMKWKLILFLIGCIFIYFLKWKPSFREDAFLLFFGLPGSGKTTALAYMIQYFLRQKVIDVFCNVSMKGAYKIQRSDLGVYDPHVSNENAFVAFDEGSIEYFKRDFAKFGPEENSFHTYHRHYKVMEAFFCQTWDGIDLRLRELNSDLYYVSSFNVPIIGKIILIRTIDKSFDIKEGQPMDGYKFSGLPRWFPARPVFKHFDTYAAPQLRHKDWDKW